MHVCRESEIQHAAAETTETTLLGVLLDTLVYSVARVAAAPVVLSLINVVSDSDRCRDYPKARQRILNSINEMLVSFPAIMLSEGICRILRNYISHSKEVAVFALEVAKWIILRRPALSSDLCALVVTTLADNAVPRGAQDQDTHSCPSFARVHIEDSGHFQKRRYRNTMKRKNLVEMHDCGNYYEEESATITIQSVRDNGITTDRVFRKKNIRNQIHPGKSLVMASTGDNCSFEAILLKELLMMFHATSLSSQREFHYAPTFHSVISLACAHPRAVIVKACAVSISDIRGKELGYSVLFQRIWSAYLRSTSPRHCDALIRMYSELAVDCSVLDGNSKLCWTIARPLLKRMKYLISSKKNDGDFSRISLIRAIGHIFVHRRQCLTDASTSFQDIVEIFEHKDLWLEIPLIPIDERILLLYTLMSAGVLSLLNSVEDLPQTKEKHCEEWPFEKISCLAIHAVNLTDMKPLLSNTHKKTDVALFSSHFDGPFCAAIFDGAPLQDYLSDDILRVAVSYLGFRSVLKAAVVCKNWNRLCTDNNMWRRLFWARWKRTTEGISFKWEDYSWRDLFIRKLKRERAIRGKVSAVGWKHVLCTHPECLIVIRSESHSKLHYKKHESKDAKFVQRELKKMGLI